MENWCGVLQELALPGTGGDAATFMAAATEFVNERCWGSLSMSIFVHPITQVGLKGLLQGLNARPSFCDVVA